MLSEYILIILNVIFFIFVNYKKNKGILIDPLYLFSFIQTIIIICLIIYKNNLDTLDPTNSNNWLLWSNDLIYYQVLEINTIFHFFVIFFSLIRLPFAQKNSQYLDVINSNEINFYSLKTMIIIYFFFQIITLLLFFISSNFFNLSYLMTYWQVPSLVTNILIGLIILKFKGNFMKILLAAILPLTYFIFYNSFIVEDVAINRGGILTNIAFILIFITFFSKSFKRLIKDNLFLGLLSMFLLIGSLQIVENTNLTTGQFFSYILNGFELRIQENIAVIINAINNGSIEPKGIDLFSYILIETFYPFTGIETLSEWFANEFYPMVRVYNESAGFAFSGLAEGYLSYKIFGVILISFVISLFFKFIIWSSTLNVYLSPIIYSSLAYMPFYIYRSHSLFFIKKVEILIISITFIFIAYLIMRLFFIKNEKN